MKATLFPLLTVLLSPAFLLGANTTVWSPNPANADWSNPSNWSLGLPSAGDIAELGDTTRTSINLSAGNYSMGSIHFTAPGPQDYYPTYRFSLQSGSHLELTGNGIINDGRPASGSFYDPNSVGQYFILEKDSSITFRNATSSDITTANSIRILNHSGSIIFAGNSTAGSALLYNEGGVNPGESLIKFTDNSNAGTADIRNHGYAAHLRFEGNSHSGLIRSGSVAAGADHTISNTGEGSRIVFDDHAVLDPDTRIANSGNATAIYFEGNSTIVGNQRTAGNRSIAISRANAAGNATFYNNGTKGLIQIGGNTHINNAIFSNNGNGQSTIYITDNVTSEGFLSLINNGGISARVILQSDGANGNKIRLNGMISLFSYSTNSIFWVGNNVEITNNGSAANTFAANGTSTNAAASITITGNAKVNSNGSNPIAMRSNGTYWSVFTINGNAEVYNATINMSDTKSSDVTKPHLDRVRALAQGIVAPHEVKFIIGGNAIVSTNRSQGDLGGTATFLHITESANFITTATNANAVFGGNNARFLFDGDSNTNLNGLETRISGIDANMTITDRANFTIGNASSSNFIINGTRALMTIAGNANVTINGSLIANGSNTGARIVIRDNASFAAKEFRFDTGNFTMEISQASGAAPIQINTINTTNNAANPVILFTGDTDQQLIIGPTQASNISNLSFTEKFANPEHRGSLTFNATGRTLNLNRQNTLSGNIILENGTIILNHTNATDTASLILNGGTLSYGTTITSANELALGGLGGTGIFNASLADIIIGGNSRDSEFSGQITGSGIITKTGDGVLSFDSSDLSTYTGQLVVQNGTLGLANTTLNPLAGPLTVKEKAALRIGEGQSYAKSLIVENGGIIDVYAVKQNGTVSNGNLFIENLNGASVIDDIAYRATQNMSVSNERLSNGDLLTGFLTSNDSNLVDDINAEGGSKEYGRVRSSNTMSFILNGSVNGSNATLDLEVLTNSLAEYASNSNQAAIAAALDHVIANHPNDPLAITADYADDPREVMDSINPAGLSSMSRMVYQQTNSEIDVISSRLDMQRHLGSSLRQNRQVSDAIFRVSSNIRSFQIPASRLTASTQNTGLTISTDKTLQRQETPWSAYLAGVGSFGKMDGDERSAGYDYHMAGITLGLDKPLGVNEGIAGFQISYHHGKSELDKPSEGTVNLNSLRFAGYAGFITRSGLSVQGHAALSYHDYEAERSSFDHVNGTNTLGINKGDTEGYGAALSGELAKIYTLGKNLQWKHGPYARLTYDWVRIQDYSESGTVTSLHISQQTPDSLRSTLGWKFWYENTSASGTTLLLSARLGWAHEYNNPNQSISARFASYDAGFTVRGPNTRRDSLAYGLSAQWLLSSGRFITLQYQGDLNDDQSTHFINAALGWKW